MILVCCIMIDIIVLCCMQSRVKVGLLHILRRTLQMMLRGSLSRIFSSIRISLRIKMSCCLGITICFYRNLFLNSLLDDEPFVFLIYNFNWRTYPNNMFISSQAVVYFLLLCSVLLIPRVNRITQGYRLIISF